MADQLITELIVDAKLANQGAQEYERAMRRIEQSSARATAAVDRLGQSMDRAGQRMRDGGAAGVIAGAPDSLQRPATTAPASLDDFNNRYKQTIRLEQAGAFSVAESQARYAAHREEMRGLEAEQHASIGRVRFPKADFGYSVAPFAVAAAASNDQVLAQVGRELDAIRPDSHLQRAARAVTQAERSDPTTQRIMADMGASQPAVGPVAATALGSSIPVGVAEDAALVPVLSRLSTAIERLTVWQVQRVSAVSAAAAEPLASVVSTAGQAASITAPVTAVPVVTQSAASSAVQAAAGAATPRPRGLPELPLSDYEKSLGAVEKPTGRPSGISGLPEVPLSDYEKALEKGAPAAAAYAVGLRGVSSAVRAGTADAHAAAGATEQLAGALNRVSGAGGRVREGFVIIRELLAGNFTRLLGSATIELQRFGALGLLLNPVTLGIGATVGAMALLIRRSTDIDANIRSFDATLRTMGTSGQASGAGLEKTAEDLKHLGISADDAKKSIDAVIRAPGISPVAAPQISQIGVRVSQYSGGDPGQRVEELTKATRGGVEGLIKYGEQYNAFTRDQINTFRELERAGQGQLAVSQALDALDSHLPHTKDLLSDFQLSTQKLRNSWDDLLTSLSKSPVVDGTVNAITKVTEAAATPTGLGGIGGAALGAVALAALGPRAGIGRLAAIPTGLALGGAIGAAGEGGENPLSRNISAGATIGGLLGAASPLGPVAGSLVGGTGGAILAGVATVIIQGAQKVEWAEGGNKIAEFLRSLKPTGSPGLEFPDEAVRQLAEAIHAQAEATNKNTDALQHPAQTRSEASTRSEADRALAGLPQSTVDARFDRFGQVTAGSGQRLIDAVINAESRGNPNAVSNKGAVGIMQVLPSTAREIAPEVTREQLFNPKINIPIGTEYLRQQIEAFGNVFRGLEAYNAGPEAVRREVRGTKNLPPETVSYAQGIIRNAGLTGNEGIEALGLGRSATPAVAPTPKEQADIDELARQQRENLEVEQETPGFRQERARAAVEEERRNRAQYQSQPELQNAANEQAQTAYDQTLAIRGQKERELAQLRIQLEQEVAQASARSWEEGLQAKAHAEAVLAQRERGGAVPAIQRDTLTLQAQQAIAAGEAEIKRADTRVRAEHLIAEASQISRAATIQSTIATQAYEFAEEAARKAGAARSGTLDQEAAALARKKAQQLQSIEADREAIEAGNQLQHGRNELQAVGLRSSLVGQSGIEAERQLSLLRTQQELQDRYSQAPPEVRSSIGQQGADLANANALLAETEQHQQRINELFHDIANTVDNELGNALKNALIRTPLEAGQHIKNYWAELRSSLKSTLGDIVSGIAQAAFIKPVTSTIASGLGLGQVAQQIGGFATGGDTVVGGSGGTDSQHVQFMATPGERVIVLTPAQSAHVDKTGKLPHFATGGEYDVDSGDVSNYPDAAPGPSLYDYWQKNVGDDPAALGVLEQISKNEGTYGDASYNTLFGGQKFEGDQFPQWQGMRGPWGITHAAGAYQFQPRTYNAEQERLGLPDFSKWSQDAAAWDLALRTYNAKTGRDLRGDWQRGAVDYGTLSGQWASFKSKQPHFAGGGELDPTTGAAIFYNDAGQPFTVPGEKSTPASLSDSPSGIGQSLVDLARGGLRSEADFLSAKAADQPLLGLNRDTGEITGRIPALADFMQQGLAGGAPAGTLSSGVRLGRTAAAAEDVANVADAAGATRPPPIIAYHGSPHDFEAFDSSKIGTGEGAQAYGHGIYFADNEDVARSYRDQLTPKPDVLVGGEKQALVENIFDESSTADQRAATRLAAHYKASSIGDANVVIDRVRTDLQDAIDLHKRRLEPIEGEGWGEGPPGPAADQAVDKLLGSLLDQQSSLERMISRGVEFAPKGKMYEVGIHADPESFLHWDKPLNEQSPQVQSAIKPFLSPDKTQALEIGKTRLDTGADLYNDIAQSPSAPVNVALKSIAAGHDPTTMLRAVFPQMDDTTLGATLTAARAFQSGGDAAASAALKEVGIPGIRYLDQGSRARSEGTHNYVLFEDKNIEILRKYGLSGPPSVSQQDQTKPLPHFAGGGIYDVDTSDYSNFAGDPEAVGAAQASTAMQPAVGSIASVIKQEAVRFGQAGVDISRAGLESNAEFLSGKEAEGPLLGFRPETGEFTGRLPALAEQLTMGLTGPVALPEHLHVVHQFEGVLERVHDTEKTAGTASSALRLGGAVSGVRGLDEATQGETQPDAGGIDVLAAVGHLLPHFASGGEYDLDSGDVSNYSEAAPGVARPSVPGVMVPIKQDRQVGWGVVGSDPSNMVHMFGGEKLPPESRFHDESVLQNQPAIDSKNLVPGNGKAVDEFALPITMGRAETSLLVAPHASGSSLEGESTLGVMKGYQPHRNIIPHFAGGGEYDVTKNETIFYNDAGQPFAVPGDKSTPASLSDSSSGIGQSLVDLARGGLRSEADFLSAKAADQPLLGLNRDTGEITGRIPALADFMQQGLAGGAPAGTLSSGMRLGRAASAAEDIASVESIPHTRLYRVEVPAEARVTPPDWIAQGLDINGTKDARDRWFTATLDHLEWYRKDIGVDSITSYVDVPTAQAEQYRVSNQPREIQRFSLDPDNEFFVPREISNKRQPLAGDRVQPLPHVASAAEDVQAEQPTDGGLFNAAIPHFAGGGIYDPATGRTQYFNDAGQPFTLPGNRTSPDTPVRDGFFGALPALANAGLKDYGEFVSGAKTAGQPLLGFDREKMEFTGRIPVLGDFLASNVIDATVGGTKLGLKTLHQAAHDRDLQGKLADRMAAYGGLYETGENAPQPKASASGGFYVGDAEGQVVADASTAIQPALGGLGRDLEYGLVGTANAEPTKPAESGFFNAIPALAEGGSVVQTGAALVHAGEMVLPTEKTDDALRSVTTGLQGFSTVLGQATPGLQTLGKAASQLSGLASIMKAGESLLGAPAAAAGPLGTTLSGAGLSNAQLTFNVSSLAPGSSITGPAQGGTINSTGNITTIAGAAAGVAPTPPEPTGPSASASLPPANAGSASQASGSRPEAGPLVVLTSGMDAPHTIPAGQLSFSPGRISVPTQAASTVENLIVGAPNANEVAPSGSILSQPQDTGLGPADFSSGAVPQGSNAALPAVAPSPGLVNPSTIGSAISGLSLIDKLNTNLPGFLPSALQSGGSLSGVGSFLSNPFGLFATQMPAGQAIAQGLGRLAPNAAGNVTVPGLFGTTATFGSFLSGAGAGFGAGALLNNLLGGNPVGGTAGSAGGALAGAAIGSFLFPGVGTLVGGLIGGTAGGGLGGLIGGRPSGQSAGAIVGPNGQLQFQDAGGSAANIQASSQVAEQIGSFTRALSQLTDAEGKPIGTNLTGLAVSSNNKTGITVTGSDIPGGQFGQNADNAVKQTELQIIQSLTNVSGTLGKILKNINDPAQLQNAVQFADVYDKLNVTSAELTASLNGNTNAIGPFSQALTQVNSTFSQLTAQAQQFGVSTAPIAAGLDAVTKTLNQDFGINVAEALSTAIDGGNDFIASLIKIHQQFIQNTNDATALATGVPTGVTRGFANGTLGSSSGTPPGWILVGERGPEWMFQPGGATVLANGQQPADVPNPEGRSFAQGTIGIGDIAGQVPSIGSAISEAAGGPSLLDAAGGAVGIGADTLSTIGSVLPIAGPLLGGALAAFTGHPLQGAIGATASLVGFALGGPIGGVIGGLVGLLGNLFGPKPSNRASGDVIDLASGTVSGFQSAGDSKADQEVQQVSEGISRITTSFQQATGGTLSGSLNVQDGRRDGLKTSYSGPLGHIDAKWGSVSDAIGQFGLAIAHNLQGIDPTLQAQLAGINDPNALIPAIEQFTGKSIDLSSNTPVAGPSAAGTDQSQAPAAASAAAPATGGDAAAPAVPAAAPAATGMVWAAPTTDPALLKIFPQLGVGPTVFSDAGAVPGFANGGTTPAGWILVGEHGPEWMFQAGGATVLRNGVQPGDVPDPAGRSFADGTTDIATAINDLNNGGALSPADIMAISQYEGMTGQSLDQIQGEFDAGALGVPAGAPVPATAAPADAAAAPTVPSTLAAASSTTPTIGATPVQELLTTINGTEAAQAGPVLAGLGLDQLTTVINSLKDAAPEISQMAQALVDSGNALPDIMTQGIQALTDPLDLAIEKEKAAGQERVTIAQQTGQDLVEAQQLTSANLVQAVLNNLGNQNAINAISYPGNAKALETLQAAPTLAQLSGQQLNAIVSSVWQVAPDLAALASGILQNNAALPDNITQELEGIVNPLQLALQQQAAQSAARNEIGQATGQDPNQVGALNTASVVQAVLQQISNPQALQALVYGHGNLQSLTALQGGQLIAGLGTDQLNAIISQIWQVAPQLSAMASGLLASGKALPDYLTQQIEAITESGVLAVQKAAATGYEQVITAQATGQDVGNARQLGTAEVSQAVAQATNTQIPVNGLPDWLTQLEEASTAPLQLAIQKEQAAGAQRVTIAQATGDDLVRVQKVNADAIAQIWYQATQQLTSLKNDITSGSLSGLTPANQVTASVEHFNTVLGLVQGGNTNFIGELANAGQAAVQAAQQAYGNGPQTASVREQVYQAISPVLVSASGYPTSGATAIAAGGSTSSLAAGVLSTGTSDLQANTAALQGLTAAVTNATPGTASGPFAASGQASPNAVNLTTNPVTGQSFTGTGITAVTPNFPSFPSASTLSGALSDAIASRATDSDWATINQAVQAGILDPNKQPGYALVIGQAQQWAAGQAINPSNGLSQALSDATNGTPSPQEWALINQAVNAGILSPVAQPQYATIIHQARQIANAQAVSLSQIPNNQTDYFAQINGLPRFAAGTESTPPGLILVGEKGPEAYHPANDNAPWRMVGVDGPELFNQPGGATILPLPLKPSQRFADGTSDWQAGRYAWANATGSTEQVAKALEKIRTDLLGELQASRKVVTAGHAMEDEHTKTTHELTRQLVRNTVPNLQPVARRAVG